MSARSVECQCNDRFTCGHCLRNAKPWMWTPSPPRSFLEYCQRKDQEERAALAKVRS